MRDSLLHDSGLGAAATISDGMAGRAAPGGRRARRACTGICLHACLLRAAARGGLPGMHWDFSYPAGWLAEVLPDIVCLCRKRALAVIIKLVWENMKTRCATSRQRLLSRLTTVEHA